MPEPRTARIRIDALGMGTVEVDGHDIGNTVLGLTLSAKAGHQPTLVLDLCMHAGEIDGQGQVHIPAETAATLVALGWTPPDDQPVDELKAIATALIPEDRESVDGEADQRADGAPTLNDLPDAQPRLVKVDGVLTEGDADTAREALRQMNADPYGLKAGLTVQPYTDHGSPRYVFRCWGTDDGCEGLVSLDHTTRTSAESARDRHLAEAHQAAGGTPR